ncbi:hypothetical protein ACHAPT_007119 [Fusarium lateritium]
MSSTLLPTYVGYIHTTLDALIIFEACLSGARNHVPRRPQDRERQELIRSGNVFIYEEHASGIKRWTDGVSWSPSRILDNFLVYRELERPFGPGEKKRALKKPKKMTNGITKPEPRCETRDEDRALIGSLVDSYDFKQSGLVKKTISITFQGVPHHLVSYYTCEDVKNGGLICPSNHPDLRNLIPRSELLMSQNFRAPIDGADSATDERFHGGVLLDYGYNTAISPAWLEQKTKEERAESALQNKTNPPPPPRPAVLHEDIYTLPNILTFTRLAAAPVIGYLVLHDQHAWAVGLFAYAGVTDLLDGWIARRWNCKTVVGTVIDPMADKTLMTILTVCLAVKGALPVWVAVVILGRDVGLAISAIYYRWISLPPPKTFARYWDFSLPSAEVRPTTISKYNTFLQLALVGVTTAAPLVGTDLTPALTIMQYVVAATTVWSGASYIYTKDAVKILNKPKP